MRSGASGAVTTSVAWCELDRESKKAMASATSSVTPTATARTTNFRPAVAGLMPLPRDAAAATDPTLAASPASIFVGDVGGGAALVLRGSPSCAGAAALSEVRFENAAGSGMRHFGFVRVWSIEGSVQNFGVRWAEVEYLVERDLLGHDAGVIVCKTEGATCWRNP